MIAWHVEDYDACGDEFTNRCITWNKQKHGHVSFLTLLFDVMSMLCRQGFQLFRETCIFVTQDQQWSNRTWSNYCCTCITNYSHPIETNLCKAMTLDTRQWSTMSSAEKKYIAISNQSSFVYLALLFSWKCKQRKQNNFIKAWEPLPPTISKPKRKLSA